MAQMGFFDLSDRYASLDAKNDPLVEIDAAVPWEEFRRLCQVIDAPRLHAYPSLMISQISQPRLKGFRFPRSIISYAVWAYHRFALSLRDVEDLMAERGVIVSYESIRVWCQRFGTQIAAKIRRDRPTRSHSPSPVWSLPAVQCL